MPLVLWVSSVVPFRGLAMTIISSVNFITHLEQEMQFQGSGETLLRIILGIQEFGKVSQSRSSNIAWWEGRWSVHQDWSPTIFHFVYGLLDYSITEIVPHCVALWGLILERISRGYMLNFDGWEQKMQTWNKNWNGEKVKGLPEWPKSQMWLVRSIGRDFETSHLMILSSTLKAFGYNLKDWS